MFDKEKMSFWTRIRLCWTVLTTGAHNPTNYLSRHAVKQLKICQKREKEMQLACRPRTRVGESEYMGQ
jgi:hypothetical protein